MNWDEVGAIGQMLGSLAVFITLVYLSVQTRHARSESRNVRSVKVVLRQLVISTRN